jgi:hypothetical protein
MEALPDEALLLVLELLEVNDLRAATLTCKRLCDLCWYEKRRRFRRMLDQTEHINGEAAEQAFILSSGRLPLLFWRALDDGSSGFKIRGQGLTLAEGTMVGPWLDRWEKTLPNGDILQMSSTGYFDDGILQGPIRRTGLVRGALYLRHRSFASRGIWKIDQQRFRVNNSEVLLGVIDEVTGNSEYRIILAARTTRPIDMCIGFHRLHDTVIHYYTNKNGSHDNSCHRGLYDGADPCRCMFLVDGDVYAPRDIYEELQRLLQE